MGQFLSAKAANSTISVSGIQAPAATHSFRNIATYQTSTLVSGINRQVYL
jgi:hypothetical protein